MKYHLTIMLLCSLACISRGQNLAAYVAYNDNLNVFDAGTFSKPELNKVSKLYFGYCYVAYVSFDSKLKFYWRNNVNDINESAFVTKVMPSKYLFTYMMDRQLKVIDKGKDRTLSNWCDAVTTTDSLIAYFDGNKNQNFVYYNGDVYLLDDVLSYSNDLFAAGYAAAGNNIFLYVNSYRKLRVMYQGSFFDLCDYTTDVKFDAGTDIAVFNNTDVTAWKAYSNGLSYTLESLMPQSYQLGTGMVAYVDNANQFKVFYNNVKIDLLTYPPARYQVVDSIIEYNDNVNNWYVFYAGKSYKLQNYVPQKIKISEGTLAFIDNLGRLQVFQNGVAKVISYEMVNDFDVNGNVVTYTLGEHDVKIYWNGISY